MPRGKRAGKVKDKWREKRWVTVLASPSFDRVPIAYVPITSEKLAMGRVIETTLFDITKQDPQQNMLIKLHFQIVGVDGNIGRTVLKGHEYSREYLRSLVRRGASMVNFIREYKTKDKATVRVYVVAFTVGRINSSRKHEIRLACNKILLERTSELFYEQFAQEAVDQSLAHEMYDACKNIAKIRHLGVRKVKLIKAGEGMDATLATPSSPEEEEEDMELEEAEAREAEEAPEVPTPKVASQ